MSRADIVICGAGIAGIATAYHLACRHHIHDVILVDERPPLTLTSDKSSEGYRNWWPGPDPAMVQLMNRSLDLLETWAAASDNRFQLNRRGYVYLSANPARIEAMHLDAQAISALGAGPLRLDDPAYTVPPEHGYSEQPDGADLLRVPRVIQQHYPFLAADTTALLHARRCGWLSAQQLGMYLLEEARAAGVQFVHGRVSAVTTSRDRIQAVQIVGPDGTQEIATPVFINAAGPFINQVADLLHLELPVFNEPHFKVAFEDSHNIIARDAPLMIWNDPIRLPWTAEERRELEADKALHWLLDPLPPGLHFRPEGGAGSQTILALWPYHLDRTSAPTWPLHPEPDFVDIVIRGLTRMVPGLSVYIERLPRPYIDGGYYCKTAENRPLICPLPISGAYLIGALSGYGIMAAPAAGELLAAWIGGSSLPAHAPAFDLARYDDPAYQQLLTHWSATTGQL